MKNWIRNLLITVASVGLAIIIGCSAMMDGVTPCEIEEGSLGYTSQPPKKYMPFTTLLDSKRIGAWMDYTHETKQMDYQRLAQDDSLLHSFLTDRRLVHEQGAMEFQQTVFSPQGPIGLLIPSLFAGTLGALLIKRPGDKSKKEVETEEKIKTENNSPK